MKESLRLLAELSAESDSLARLMSSMPRIAALDQIAVALPDLRRTLGALPKCYLDAPRRLAIRTNTMRRTFDDYLAEERDEIASGRAPASLTRRDGRYLTTSQALGICAMNCDWCRAQVSAAIEHSMTGNRLVAGGFCPHCYDRGACGPCDQHSAWESDSIDAGPTP